MYTDHTMFPRGIFTTNALTNVAQEVSATGIKICGIVLGGGAAAEEVILRDDNAGTERMRIKVPILTPVVVPFGYDAASGLEVITASAAGDVTCDVYYVSL
jgi:hypothetical protein